MRFHLARQLREKNISQNGEPVDGVSEFCLLKEIFSSLVAKTLGEAQKYRAVLVYYPGQSSPEGNCILFLAMWFHSEITQKSIGKVDGWERFKVKLV